MSEKKTKPRLGLTNVYRHIHQEAHHLGKNKPWDDLFKLVLRTF